MAVCQVAAASVQAEQIGEVSTLQILGANNTVVIKAFNVPDISGVTCCVSRAKKTGDHPGIPFSQQWSPPGRNNGIKHTLQGKYSPCAHHAVFSSWHGYFFETIPSMATQSLQKCWLVDLLWHFVQYLRPQLLHVVREEADLPQISQVSFF